MRCPAPQRPASWLHSPSCTVDGSGLEDPLGGVCGRPSVSALWPVESLRPLSYSLGHRNIRRPRGTVASQGTNIGRASDESATQSPMKDQLPDIDPQDVELAHTDIELCARRDVKLQIRRAGLRYRGLPRVEQLAL